MNRAMFFAIAVFLMIVVVGGGYIKSNRDKNEQTNTGSNASAEPAKTQMETSFTITEVASPNAKDDCWAILDGKVHNMTSLTGSESNGEEIIKACGGDATTLFETLAAENISPDGSINDSGEFQLDSLIIGNLSN